MDTNYTVGAVGFGVQWPNCGDTLRLEAELQEARAQIALLEAEKEILLKRLNDRDHKKAPQKN